MGIAVTLLASLVGLSVVWYLSHKRREDNGVASLTEIQGQHETELDHEMDPAEDLDEIVDSGSFESFLSGVPRSEYEANVMYCNIKRLKSSGNRLEVQRQIAELLERYPHSKAARLLRTKEQMARTKEQSQEKT